MKKLKNITLIFLICIVCLSFCGCAEIGYVFVDNGDGSFNQYLTVSLDEEYLTQNEVNVTEVKNDIQTDFNEYAQRLWNGYRFEYIKIFAENPSASDLTWQSAWNGNEFSGTIYYKNSTVLSLLYYDGGTEPEIWVADENWLTTKKSVERETIFNHLEEQSFFQEYKAKYATVFDLTKVTYVYQYIANNARLHSDADSVIRLDRQHYLHTWIIDGDKADEPIQFYFVKANYANWYILAFGITISIGTIYAMIVLIVSKKKSIDKHINELKNPQ